MWRISQNQSKEFISTNAAHFVQVLSRINFYDAEAALSVCVYLLRQMCAPIKALLETI